MALKYCPDLKSAHYIPNGVDCDRFAVIEQGNEARQLDQAFRAENTILLVSRLEAVKGVIYLIEALPQIVKRIKNIKVIIIGDGEQQPLIKRRIGELKMENFVVLKGRIEYRHIQNYYPLADVVVLPSLDEATSITGLEAMASGKPLVGTTVGGIPALIDEGKNGFLVPPGDPQKLAEAIVAVLENPQRRIEMGKFSRQKAVNEFSWEKIAQETLKIYESCRSNS